MRSETDALVMGFDVGTTAVKGLVFNLNGEELFSRRLTYPTSFPRPGWMEQDPDNWLDCIAAIIHEAVKHIDATKLCGMGICSQVNTHVFVGSNGVPLRHAITWQDQRCSGVALKLEQKTRECNLNMAIDASSLLSRAEWMKTHEPNIWKETRWILSPKDYCVMKLTGQVASDGLSSVGLVKNIGNYDDKVINLVDGLAERLPGLKPITSIAGDCIDRTLPLSCPLVTGTMDAWASFYGSGLSGPGQGFQISGTSEIVGLLSTECHPTPGVVSFPPVDNLYLHAGPTQAGGDALSWLSHAMNKNIDTILKEANARAPLQVPLVFLPYLMGERAPLWDANARGTFCGLAKSHTQADMTLAVFEGVGFSARHLTEELEKAAGFSCDRLCLSGGAADIDLWCQIKADTMGRTLQRLENINTGSLGAALMAMKGIGAYDSIQDAMASTVRVGKTFEPEAGTRDRYDALYCIYRDTYSSLTSVFSNLSKLQQAYTNQRQQSTR